MGHCHSVMYEYETIQIFRFSEEGREGGREGRREEGGRHYTTPQFLIQGTSALKILFSFLSLSDSIFTFSLNLLLFCFDYPHDGNKGH